MGAVVPFYLMDSGSGIDCDSKYVEWAQVLSSRQSRITITWFGAKLTEHPAEALVGTLDGENGARLAYVQIPDDAFYGILETGLEVHNMRVSGVRLSKTDGLPFNSHFVGKVRSGGAVIYERPAGTMRLRLVFESPTLAAIKSPDVELLPGKKYIVEYHHAAFSAGKFTIKEEP